MSEDAKQDEKQTKVTAEDNSSELSSNQDEKQIETPAKDNSCGLIIYQSASLANRILKYKEDDDVANEDDILRSTDSEIPLKLLFINESDQELYLYWINHEGGIRVPGTSMKPHSQHKINSYISHPFILSLSSECTFTHFKDIIGVYIGHDMSYSQHNIIIDKSAALISCTGVKMDVNQRKTWALSSYHKYVIHGFTVYFEVDLQDKYGALMHVLNNDLAKINEVVPCAALKILQSTSIWLNDNYLYYDYKVESKDKSYRLDVYKPKESMCFHPDPEWLTEHGNMSHKAECIEIYRVKDWIKERGYMPMVLLHELAHSYHWYLDFERDDVLNAYNAAKDKNGLYRDIPFVLGGTRDAYALTNQMEYFSELTECYFGLNDFYPFNNEELKDYDPCGYNLMQTLWSLNDKQILLHHKTALRNRHRRNRQRQKEIKNNLLPLELSRLISL